MTRTGCSGWGHVTDLARDEREGDTVFEQDGVKIYVDAKSLALVDGTVIDFGKQGLSETFTFSNPNATAECGCGELHHRRRQGLRPVLAPAGHGRALGQVQPPRAGCPAPSSAP